MAEEEIIPLETFCSYYQVEQTFLETLESHGLISISYRENKKYLLKKEMLVVERFSRMYYELNINVEGIDVMNNLLEKIKLLQQQTDILQARLRIYE